MVIQITNSGSINYTSTVKYADGVSYSGFYLNPTPVPNSVYGEENYYEWRANDFYVRQALMTPWYKSSPNVPDYYMGYGDKYIHRFSNELYPNLTVQGQEWLSKTLLNLQSAMEIELAMNPRIEEDNSLFRNFAFDSHVPSYENAGLFDLPISDLVKIVNTPDILDIIRPEGIKQINAILKDYVNHAEEHPVSTAFKFLEFAIFICKNTNE